MISNMIFKGAGMIRLSRDIEANLLLLLFFLIILPFDKKIIGSKSFSLFSMSLGSKNGEKGQFGNLLLIQD